MRIIAGDRRGHRIDGPLQRELRPTGDKVREACFNILRDRIEDREILDLFSGTGALGLEALSRGAHSAIFVERDRRHAALVLKNLSTLRYEDRGHVVTTDAYRWVKGYQPLGGRSVAAFLDPPYEDFDRRTARVRAMIEALAGRMPPGSTILVESGRELGSAELGETGDWESRRYGSTWLTIRSFDDGPAEVGDEPATAEEG